MVQIIMDRGGSGCFGTSLAPKVSTLCPTSEGPAERTMLYFFFSIYQEKFGDRRS